MQLDRIIIRLLREIRELMSANDDALATLTTQVTEVQVAVGTVQADIANLIASLATPAVTNSDISAGVNAAAASLANASATLATVAAEVKAATPPPVPVPSTFTIPDQTLNAALGANVDYQITAAGTTIGTITFQPIAGLPAGLSVDATGHITGSVLASFSGTLTVNASDQSTPAQSATGNLSIAIA